MAVATKSRLNKMFPKKDSATSSGTLNVVDEEKGREPDIAPSNSTGPVDLQSLTPFFDHSRVGPSDEVLPEQDIPLQKLNTEINELAKKIEQLEKEINRVKNAAESGVSFRGKEGEFLRKEEQDLREEKKQLRTEKEQLREEKLERIRSRRQSALGSTGGQSRRVSILWANACIGDPDGVREEKTRLDKLSEKIRTKSSEQTIGVSEDGCEIITIYRSEEDVRLPSRLSSFANPILVSTLTAGFCLMLFEISRRELTKKLAVVAFALELAASMALSGIAFHAQQQYSYSTNMEPKTRIFLGRIRPVTICALAFFFSGVVLFAAAFMIEVVTELGIWWSATVAVLFFPSMVGGGIFIFTIAYMRRISTVENSHLKTKSRVPVE